MMLEGKCTKCGCTVQLDIGTANDEEEAKQKAREALRTWTSFSCPGHHVEICSPYPHYWNVDEWKLVSGNAPTEEEFVNDLKSKYKEVLDTDEMWKRGVITGFAYGIPVTNDGLNWDFVESPRGKRYYYRN